MQMLWLKAIPKEIIGNVFETGIFSELIKKYSRKNVFYWRTRDKKEIDFILKSGGNVLPIEAKLNFAQFDIGAIRHFNQKYNLNNYRLAGFNGKQADKYSIYPWQCLSDITVLSP